MVASPVEEVGAAGGGDGESLLVVGITSVSPEGYFGPTVQAITPIRITATVIDGNANRLATSPPFNKQAGYDTNPNRDLSFWITNIS